MLGRVLVLGAGNRRSHDIRFGRERYPLSAQGPNFDDNFSEVVTIDMDPDCNPTYVHDLTTYPWPVEGETFDEIHAYELLEHLTYQGDYEAFFTLWKQIWRVTAPQGLVVASTPCWDSVWGWGDPGHRMVYSPATLTYLDQDQYEKQVGNTTMTDYRAIWPRPYHFKLVWFTDKKGGFKFALQRT